MERIVQRVLERYVLIFLFGLIVIGGCGKVERQSVLSPSRDSITAEPSDMTGKGSHDPGHDPDEPSPNDAAAGRSGGLPTIDSAESVELPTGPHVPNELGVIPILEFHRFGEENERWTVRWDDFRSLLQELYDQGFRPVNMIDVVERNIDLPRGYAPVVLTFDDGNEEQFRWAEQSGMSNVAEPDPKSAVGMLLDFHRQNPDWALRGTFYINKPAFGPKSDEEKLRWLIEHGFEVGNHTLNHTELRGKEWDVLRREIGGLAAWVQKAVPGYEVKTLAYPNGIVQSDIPRSVWSGTFDGEPYAIEAALLVGAGPALSPYDKDWRPFALPRIQVAAPDVLSEADRPFVWEGWKERLLSMPGRLYASDGDPDVITIPPGERDRLSEHVNLVVVEAEMKNVADP